MSFFSLEGAHSEYSILQNMGHEYHPNIIKCLDYFEDTSHIVIVLEYMVSDFRTVLMELTYKLTEEQVKMIFLQMVRAVDMCHLSGVVHRDVKLENFLV